MLANIFLGQIKKWNDPAIKKLNPGKSLPDLDITSIHRCDNSGTTYNLTDYLEQRQPAVEERVGKGVAVNWPTGVGARGSSGVAAALTQTNGGITYVDVAYSLVNHFKFAAVKNNAGMYQLPGLRGITAAAATIIRVAPDNGGISIVNPAKRQTLAYPICTFTYVIVPKQTAKAEELQAVHPLGADEGSGSGPKLLFSPTPEGRPEGVAEDDLSTLIERRYGRGTCTRSADPGPGRPMPRPRHRRQSTTCFTIARPRPVPREARARSLR